MNCHRRFKCRTIRRKGARRWKEEEGFERRIQFVFLSLSPVVHNSLKRRLVGTLDTGLNKPTPPTLAAGTLNLTIDLYLVPLRSIHILDLGKQKSLIGVIFILVNLYKSCQARRGNLPRTSDPIKEKDLNQ